MSSKTVWRLLAVYGVLVILICPLLVWAVQQDCFPVTDDDRVAATIIFPIAAAVGLLLIILAVGIGMFVYTDAKRRGMEPLLWTLVAIFIPYLLGLVIYLVARQPLLIGCPACGARSPGKASYCPACGKAIVRTCPKCQTPVLNGARFCTACGSGVAPA